MCIRRKVSFAIFLLLIGIGVFFQSENYKNRPLKDYEAIVDVVRNNRVKTAVSVIANSHEVMKSAFLVPMYGLGLSAVLVAFRSIWLYQIKKIPLLEIGCSGLEVQKILTSKKHYSWNDIEKIDLSINALISSIDLHLLDGSVRRISFGYSGFCVVSGVEEVRNKIPDRVVLVVI